jgi:hypothetical protein
VEALLGVGLGALLGLLGVLGRKRSAQTLISFAFAYEQLALTRAKIKPYISPKTQLKDVIKGLCIHELPSSSQGTSCKYTAGN